jgi:hypothetical protein
MYIQKSAVPSFIIILMGSLDCITTVVGVMFFGASELNPFLVGIVSTNILAFLALKIAATFFIGFSYILAKKTLNKTMDKTTKSFRFSSVLLKGAYAGLIVFLAVVVVNNLLILIG